MFYLNMKQRIIQTQITQLFHTGTMRKIWAHGRGRVYLILSARSAPKFNAEKAAHARIDIPRPCMCGSKFQNFVGCQLEAWQLSFVLPVAAKCFKFWTLVTPHRFESVGDVISTVKNQILSISRSNFIYQILLCKYLFCNKYVDNKILILILVMSTI